MSDEEFEKFEITDYDLDNEFNPNRKHKRSSKQQQIYGIWADDSDDDNDNNTSRYAQTSRSNRQQAKKDYSAPVSFVSAKRQPVPKTETIQDNISDEEDDKPSLNVGNTSSESEEEPVESTTRSMAGFRKVANNAVLSKGVGTWEQHTRGIGAKLLKQMGYEPGKGLGKKLQGIATPVQAAVRKGRGAIGLYGPEVKSTLADQKEQVKVDEDEKETLEFKEKMQQWRKDAPTKKGKKTRYYYRTVEDIIEKGKKPGHNYNEKVSSKFNNVRVIDMTGPEARVLSGYRALGQTKITDDLLYEHRPTKKCNNFVLPELLHNLNIIVEQCEQEIIKIDKSQRSINDRNVITAQEKEKLIKITDLEKDHIQILEDALDLVESLTNPNCQLNLERAEAIFIQLQSDHFAEYKEFGLCDLAPGVIGPLISTRLKDWNPLEQPNKHIELLNRWKTIIGIDLTQKGNVFDPYSALVWSGVVPSFRSASAAWNPRDHQPMVALLDAWSKLLPSWILESVLEQMILPKLHSAVESWDPLTDIIPIHLWILPWSGLLGDKLDENVYPIIREKLGNALKEWMPHDRSARAMLTPWSLVFGTGDLQTFLLKHIVPKLQLCLSDLIINPLQQDLEIFNQVWEWNELIPPVMMAQILDKNFFPKWMQTLVIWLNQSPNLDQVSRWYSGWKNILSDGVIQQTNIKEHFRRALELMQRSTGSLIGESSAPTSSLPVPPKLMDLQIPPPSMEFKDLVSQKCAERGIIFAPMPGRREMGKQVYRVGKMFCYIDRSVLMISDGSLSNWSPISLVSLLEKC